MTPGLLAIWMHVWLVSAVIPEGHPLHSRLASNQSIAILVHCMGGDLSSHIVNRALALSTQSLGKNLGCSRYVRCNHPQILGSGF